jgi:peptidoglycan/xylan/chitin deacetylase (PgdA/CDA1 family)
MSASHYIGFKSVAETWKNGDLILMYHAVDVPPLFYGMRGLYVTPQCLFRQIGELQEAAIEFSNLDKSKQGPFSDRRVVLTFDDAYENLFLKGLPVLQKAGVRAITFIVASLIGKKNAWDHSARSREEPLMDRAQIVEWLAAGQEIGAHTMTHPHLAEIPLDQARREIADSKKKLEDLFGIPIRHFCYPYGSWNQAVRDLVEEAGYETATSTIHGFNTATTDTFILRRYMGAHRRPILAAVTRW